MRAEAVSQQYGKVFDGIPGEYSIIRPDGTAVIFEVAEAHVVRTNTDIPVIYFLESSVPNVPASTEFYLSLHKAFSSSQPEKGNMPEDCHEQQIAIYNMLSPLLRPFADSKKKALEAVRNRHHSHSAGRNKHQHGRNDRGNKPQFKKTQQMPVAQQDAPATA